MINNFLDIVFKRGQKNVNVRFNNSILINEISINVMKRGKNG